MFASRIDWSIDWGIDWIIASKVKAIRAELEYVRLLERWILLLRHKNGIAVHQACKPCPDRTPSPQSHKLLYLDIRDDNDKELELLQRLLRFLEHLALLLLCIFRYLLGRSRFGCFPNRQRPRCTTMPWTIWPSLVVLWGVCWMFYPPLLERNPLDLGDYFDGALFFPPGLEQSFDPGFSLASPNPDLFYGDLDFGAGFQDPSSSYNPYLSNGNADPIPSDLSSTQVPANPAPPVSGFPPRRVVTSLPPPMSNIKSHVNVESSIAQPKFHHSNFPVAIGSQHLLCNASPAVAPWLVSTSIHGQPGSHLQQPSPTSSSVPHTPPKDADGNFIYTYSGCKAGSTFKYISEWQIHMGRHTRQFKCTVPGCKGSSGFGSKGDLARHTTRVHPIAQAASPVPPGQSLQFDAQNATNASHSTTQNVLASDSAGKRKRKSSNQRSMQDVTVAGAEAGISLPVSSTKKARVMDQDSDTAAPARINSNDLIQEHEKLRRERDEAHEDLRKCREERDKERQEREKERDMLLGIIDRLSKR